MMEEKQGYLETSIDFDENNFYLDGELIGAEVEFEFRERAYAICFPNFDLDEMKGMEETELVFYRPKTTNRDTNVKLSWFDTSGDRRPYGRAGLNIKTKTVHTFSCSQMIIRSKEMVTLKEALSLKQDLLDWKNLFIGWQSVLNFQDLTGGNSLKVEQEEDLECYVVELPNGGFEPVAENQSFSSNIILTGSAPIISSARDIKKTVDKCSLDLPPFDVHLRLINSLKLYRQDEYRQSLLDSATAAEMALTALLDIRLKDVEDSARTLITKKYMQIGNLLEALKGLEVDIHFDDIYKKIAEPRNKAIHKGATVSKEQAEDALKVAKKLIYDKLQI